MCNMVYPWSKKSNDEKEEIVEKTEDNTTQDLPCLLYTSDAADE